MIDFRRKVAQNQIDVTVSQTTQSFTTGPTGLPVQTQNDEVYHRYRQGSFVSEVPPHARADARRDYSQTKIVLAFPVNSDGAPIVERVNHVFAYLPIRSFGFRFVVQADFLLVANREVRKSRAAAS